VENGREDRVKKELPVTVSGEDAQGNPFRLNTYTLDLSPHGAHVGRLPPLRGPDETLEIQHQGKRARYRVIWVGEPGTRLEGHAGLRCEDQQPPDWALPQQFAVEWPGSLTGGAPAPSTARASSRYRWPVVVVLALAVILVGSYLARREQVAKPAPPPATPVARPAEQLPGEPLTPMPPLAPQPEQPPASATGPVEPMTPSVAPAFAVQVGAFENRQTAEVLARRLNATYKHDVVVSPLQTRGAMVYRVRIPVATEEEARELARQLAAEQSVQTLIVPLTPE
jgi:cell division septation protein DedD